MLPWGGRIPSPDPAILGSSSYFGFEGVLFTAELGLLLLPFLLNQGSLQPLLERFLDGSSIPTVDLWLKQLYLTLINFLVKLFLFRLSLLIEGGKVVILILVVVGVLSNQGASASGHTLHFIDVWLESAFLHFIVLGVFVYGLFFVLFRW